MLYQNRAIYNNMITLYFDKSTNKYIIINEEKYK